MFMDLPEPGVPKMARDPLWYQSLRDDLAGPAPGGYSEQIRKCYTRAERNARAPKRTYGPNDPRDVAELERRRRETFGGR